VVRATTKHADIDNEGHQSSVVLHIYGEYIPQLTRKAFSYSENTWIGCTSIMPNESLAFKNVVIRRRALGEDRCRCHYSSRSSSLATFVAVCAKLSYVEWLLGWKRSLEENAPRSSSRTSLIGEAKVSKFGSVVWSHEQRGETPVEKGGMGGGKGGW